MGSLRRRGFRRRVARPGPAAHAGPPGRHARGPEDAPIQLVEFSDFQCPHCARAHVMLKDLLSRYPNEVRFVFHHFPLSNLCNDAMQVRGHESSCEAAAASECAADQGQFDPFTNLLFAHQDRLDSQRMRSIARETPHRPAQEVVPAEWVEVLSQERRVKTGKTGAAMTIQQFLRHLAGLGGHLGRKCDGQPGWITLWRGLEKLLLILRGHRCRPARCG